MHRCTKVPRAYETECRSSRKRDSCQPLCIHKPPTSASETLASERPVAEGSAERMKNAVNLC